MTLRMTLEKPESSPTLSLLSGYLLFIPGFLRKCYFFIEVKLLNQDISCIEHSEWIKKVFFFFLEHYVLWIQFFLHFIQWSYYIIQYFSIQYFFHFIFWFLYIKDTNYRLIGFSLLLFDFFICVVCNYLVFSSLPVIWFSYVRSLMILIKLFIFKYCLFGPQFISFSLRTPFPSHSVILSPLSSFYNESFKDTEKLKEFIVATYIPILQIL